MQYGKQRVVRDSIDTDDVALPTVGTGASFTVYGDCKYVEVAIIVSGTGVSWDVTPLFGATIGVTGYYFKGEKKTGITENTVYTLEVNNASDVNFLVDNSSADSGETPTISVYVRPIIGSM